MDMCPTPSHFASLDVKALASCVHSLGFQYERMRGLADVTSSWLTRGEFKVDNIPVAKGGNKIVQCGSFAIDSYHVFCRGDAKWKVDCGIADVDNFQRWQKRVGGGGEKVVKEEMKKAVKKETKKKTVKKQLKVKKEE